MFSGRVWFKGVALCCGQSRIQRGSYVVGREGLGGSVYVEGRVLSNRRGSAML